MRRFSLALCLGLAVLAAQSAWAETAFERAKREGTLKVAVYNQAPWGIRQPDGTFSGFSVDVLRTALEGMGIKTFDPVISEFSALIPGLLAKRFDVLTAGLFITPQRCQLVAFGDPDIRMGDALLVKAGNPKNIHSYEDIARNPDLTIGTGRGNSTAADAVAAGVPSDRQLLFPDNQAAVSALIAGRVDAVSATAASIAAIYKDVKDKGLDRATPFHGVKDAQGNPRYNFAGVAFRPEDTDFRDAYNAQMKRMREDGTLLKILEKYGFSEADLPTVSAKELCAK